MPYPIPKSIHSLREQIDAVLRDQQNDIESNVRNNVAIALNVPAQNIPDRGPLLTTLGADSLDFLDLIYRIERHYGIKLPRGGIRQAVHSTLGERAESADGSLSDEAVEILRFLMPEIPASVEMKGLSSAALTDIFTLQSLVRLVAWGLSDKRPTS